MITKQGEALIAKYLLGQAPTYASYISFGCGAVPGQSPTGTETSMKFEMLRVPISSRSFVNEDDFNRISFAGELPLETQYKITEVALWSDSANALASSDSNGSPIMIKASAKPCTPNPIGRWRMFEFLASSTG